VRDQGTGLGVGHAEVLDLSLLSER